MSRRSKAVALAALGSAALLAASTVSSAAEGGGPAAGSTATPIKHLVAIYQENVSFDHYFGTYPRATNTSGQVCRCRSTRHG